MVVWSSWPTADERLLRHDVRQWRREALRQDMRQWPARLWRRGDGQALLLLLGLAAVVIALCR